MGIHVKPLVMTTFDFSAANWTEPRKFVRSSSVPMLEAAQTCHTINNKAKTKEKGQKSVSINFTVSL